MMDAKVLSKNFSSLFDHLVIILGIGFDQMNRQRSFSGTQCPDMKVVGRLHTGQVLEMFLNSGRIDALGYGIHCQVHGVL